MIDFNKFFGEHTSDKKSIGIGGWTAEVRISQNLQMTSQAPDNYLEDGSVIQDHIINNPTIIEITGEVAEVNIKQHFSSDTFVKPIDKAQNILNSVFPSSLTNQATEKVKSLLINTNTAFTTLSSYENNVENLYSIYKNKTPKDIQKEFISFLNRVFKTKMLLAIETPFGTFKNMRIISLAIQRDNTTNQAIKYQMTIKQLRFAKTLYVLKEKYFKNPTGSVTNKTKSKKYRGEQQGTKQPESFLYKMMSIF